MDLHVYAVNTILMYNMLAVCPARGNQVNCKVLDIGKVGLHRQFRVLESNRIRPQTLSQNL